MRILFTGGGSGGHFYPIIAVAQEFNNLIKEKRLVGAELFYMSPTPYNEGVLFENNITYKKNTAGKLRRYFSILNFFDLFKTGWGVIQSFIEVYKIYPDVVFAKGGYASFPVLLSAKILRIPVVIHESDSVPGRVNAWAGKFAKNIAISYPEAAKYFPAEKVAYTGNPVRKDVAIPITDGAKEFLKLDSDLPLIFILGGSQGAKLINDTVLEGLASLVEKYQIIHQTGKNNFKEVVATADAVLYESKHKDRYKSFDYLNELAMRMAAGEAKVIVSRAGSTIFEIASWAVPSILLPITDSNGDHQRQNAFSYARHGGCVVIEEKNLTFHILASEIDRLMTHSDEASKMREAAKTFYKPEAARTIAEEILKIALTHEIQ
ncbi:MAG: UDP-N-acetylglucosamine--N-acetylmuramyl-(pentapeptide) pyrophosphoryl-undecaprenol N-acetylglucosamine transferase [bacterium]|nr:UDP-N-acetylglucosamine--N-acetylmuramyl-(pentapeptide) pyrophosphoryl-undecaprenol N-acetylglucosamine transferase [bacterium]